MINLDKFDPTDANKGAEAAERANDLEQALNDILECLAAKQSLSGTQTYKGVGIQALKDKADQLPAAIRWAEALRDKPFHV